MKVASTFNLRQSDENLFKLWLETIPVNFSNNLKERLWLKSIRYDFVIWTKAEGFLFHNK
jgi:hypothetical protein